MIYLLNILIAILRRQLKVEYETHPRKAFQKTMTDDLATSSESELKKLFLQDFSSFSEEVKPY